MYHTRPISMQYRANLIMYCTRIFEKSINYRGGVIGKVEEQKERKREMVCGKAGKRRKGDQ